MPTQPPVPVDASRVVPGGGPFFCTRRDVLESLTLNTQSLNSQLQEALAKSRPAGISRVLTRTGIDSTGDRAIWIWIILEDDSAAAGLDQLKFDEMREWAEQAASGVSDLWAYVSFRLESEQRELEEPKA